MPTVKGCCCFPLCAEFHFPTLSLFSCTMLLKCQSTKSFWGIGGSNYPNGVASFLRTTANGGFSIKCLYVTVGVGYRTFPLPGGGG